MGRNGSPLTLLVEMQAGVSTLDNSMEVPQKVKNRATLESINHITGYLLNEYKISN